MARDRHPKPDFEKLLREAETRGWRIDRGKGYFRCLCPCADKHWVRVVLTPSGSRTLLNTRKDFERSLHRHAPEFATEYGNPQGVWTTCGQITPV